VPRETGSIAGSIAHFFAVSAMMMRRILLDRARRRGAEKRGGARHRSGYETSAAEYGAVECFASSFF
jgi:ECF sigma factor